MLTIYCEIFSVGPPLPETIGLPGEFKYSYKSWVVYKIVVCCQYLW